MSDEKQKILDNFVRISGINDVGEAFAHLEQTNWNLIAALQRVMPQEYDASPSNTAADSPPSRANFDTIPLIRSLTSRINNLTTQAADSSSNNNRWSASTSSNANFVNFASDLNVRSHIWTHNFLIQNEVDGQGSAATPSLNAISMDTNDGEDFFTDSMPQAVTTSRYLIANNTDTETTGTFEFREKYIQRFGEPYPNFYTGKLEDAIKLACHGRAKEQKLLAIYLHHGGSILTNIFCDLLMKNEMIIEMFEKNFIIYGWDLTFESNKRLILSAITASVGNLASSKVRNTTVDQFPSLLIIGKIRSYGRNSRELLSVIRGNISLQELLSRLSEAVEIFEKHLQIAIREEDERAERDQVKAEQDFAYQQTLQADIAKEAAKKQKEAAMTAERQRLESEEADENVRREYIRLAAEQSLPLEPDPTANDVAKIRILKPTGEFVERRFHRNNTLQDLLNFVASLGYIIDEHKLIFSWPRQDLTALDARQTLQSLKLYPQETVLLDER